MHSLISSRDCHIFTLLEYPPFHHTCVPVIPSRRHQYQLSVAARANFDTSRLTSVSRYGKAVAASYQRHAFRNTKRRVLAPWLPSNIVNTNPRYDTTGASDSPKTAAPVSSRCLVYADSLPVKGSEIYRASSMGPGRNWP
jgi:hypothetical protein